MLKVDARAPQVDGERLLTAPIRDDDPVVHFAHKSASRSYREPFGDEVVTDTESVASKIGAALADMAAVEDRYVLRQAVRTQKVAEYGLAKLIGPIRPSAKCASRHPVGFDRIRGPQQSHRTRAVSTAAIASVTPGDSSVTAVPTDAMSMLPPTLSTK